MEGESWHCREMKRLEAARSLRRRYRRRRGLTNGYRGRVCLHECWLVLEELLHHGFLHRECWFRAQRVFVLVAPLQFQCSHHCHCLYHEGRGHERRGWHRESRDLALLHDHRAVSTCLGLVSWVVGMRWRGCCLRKKMLPACLIGGCDLGLRQADRADARSTAVAVDATKSSSREAQ